MRGAPLVKYQNKNTVAMEAQVDWNVYKRWTVLGFTGIGNAFSELRAILTRGNRSARWGPASGIMIARKLGTNMGIDVAFSNDDWAFYIVFGSAWLK